MVNRQVGPEGVIETGARLRAVSITTPALRGCRPALPRHSPEFTEGAEAGRPHGKDVRRETGLPRRSELSSRELQNHQRADERGVSVSTDRIN